MSIQQLRKAAEWIRGRKKEQLLISVLLLGLFLVIMMPVKETDEMKETQKTEEETLPQTPAEEEAAAKQMERQLVETLSQVEGVGEVKAAVTLETSGKEWWKRMCRSVLLTPARPRGAEKARSLSAVIPRKKPSMSGTAMEMRHPMWYRRRRRKSAAWWSWQKAGATR